MGSLGIIKKRKVEESSEEKQVHGIKESKRRGVGSRYKNVESLWKFKGRERGWNGKSTSQLNGKI